MQNIFENYVFTEPGVVEENGTETYCFFYNSGSSPVTFAPKPDLSDGITVAPAMSVRLYNERTYTSAGSFTVYRSAEVNSPFKSQARGGDVIHDEMPELIFENDLKTGIDENFMTLSGTEPTYDEDYGMYITANDTALTIFDTNYRPENYADYDGFIFDYTFKSLNKANYHHRLMSYKINGSDQFLFYDGNINAQSTTGSIFRAKLASGNFDGSVMFEAGGEMNFRIVFDKNLSVIRYINRDNNTFKDFDIKTNGTFDIIFYLSLPKPTYAAVQGYLRDLKVYGYKNAEYPWEEVHA
ncbi:MAG: hypothetical protein LBM87_00345 [Ruminococcus sp.]|jgi:hypothetical protein|nr:hypothetical protein [Ruminococcus sp.]